MIDSVHDLRTEFTSSISGLAEFFLRIDDSHCDRIHSTFITDHCFDDNYVGKQPVV